MRPLLIFSFTALFASASLAQLQLTGEVSGLSSPVAYAQDPLNASQRFVVQQGGTIIQVSGGAVQGTAYTFAAGTISTGGERGLLGMAFHPNHASNGLVYTYRTDANGHIQVSSLTRTGNTFGNLAPVMTILRSSANANHNGGTIRFGPDGFLYLGIGDGGGSNDPNRNAQNPNSLQGKMLRIDVNGDDFGGDPNRNYAIPTSNPFFGSNGPIQAVDEIWAFGVRNPYKFSFDSQNGALLIADVGQGAREEINYAAAGIGGQNYGWVKYEGSILTPGIPTTYQLAYEPHTAPISEYDHTVGRSITGGYVYRGSQLGSFYQGRYFYADFITKRVFSLGLTAGGLANGVIEHTDELGGSSVLGNISSIDVDANGELFLVTYSGTIRRITAVPEPGSLALVGFAAIAALRRRRSQDRC